MALPPLAATSDLEARLGVTLTGTDVARAEAALTDASALVRSAAGVTWSADGTTLDADLPDVVIAVTLTAARRAYENPSGLVSESFGSYSYTRNQGERRIGMYLTDEERKAVRRAAGQRTFDSLELVRTSGAGTLWVSTQDALADLVPFETYPLT